MHRLRLSQALPFLALALATSPLSAGDLLHLPGKDGAGKGKSIVIMTGDEEYRSEESGPMLGKILSQKHGFDVRVLFSIRPDAGFIDPNLHDNTPGLEHLAEADLLIIGTRFRELPDEQYAHIAAFLNAGKPVIGFRTATHAFTGKGKTGDFAWSQFGPQILGEGWVAHHGRHKVQGARGVIVGDNAEHPILNGVHDVFGPSDVYTVKRVTPENATILLRGAVTETLDPASKILVDDPKNKPMQPLAWLREYTAPDGKTKGKAVCTTMGASNDFLSEDLRRLVVNAAFHLTGVEVPEEADVAFVDPFDPTMFGFIKEKGFFEKLNLRPEDYDLGKNRKTVLPKPAAAK